MSALLVASVGGHLVELAGLAPRLDPLPTERVWVTYDNEQSRALLADEDVVYVPPMTIRDTKTLRRLVPIADRLIRERKVSSVVSTGSGIALGFLPVAAARRVPAHYIESATRLDGLSMSGRLLQGVPGVHLYHQYRATRRWRHCGSVYDGFEAEARPVTSDGEVRRVVVTVGTMVDYGFRRLIERLVEIIPDGVEVLWQTGVTDVSGLPIAARERVAADELRIAMGEADVVVAHCGVGSALTCFDVGQFPVLAPREARFGENVDDHHRVLADALAHRGLATAPPVAELGWHHLLEASQRRVVRRTEPEPFRLQS